MSNVTLNTETTVFGNDIIEIRYKGHTLFKMADKDLRDLYEQLKVFYETEQ